MNKKQRTYDKEFKLNCIKLYRDGNKSMEALCKDLGIPSSTFHGWLKIVDENGAEGLSGSGNIKPSNAEIYNLKKELLSITMERDILKKALAIFSRKKP